MKITHVNIAEYAEQHGLTPVQVDGIPEGFSFKEPDIEIGGIEHEGQYVAFLPLKEWQDEKAIIRTITIPALQTLFKRNNGK